MCIKNKIRAFTLIELLVVISIIAVLMSVLMPALAKARELAKRSICASNLHQMAIGWMAYETDYKELPPGSWGKANMVGNDAPGYVGVHRYLASSYGIPAKAVQCPSAGTVYPLDEVGKSENIQVWDGAAPWGLMLYNYLGGNGGMTLGNGYSANQLKDGWIKGKFWARDYGFIPSAKTITVSNPKINPLFLDIASWLNATYFDKVEKFGNHKPTISSHSKGATKLGQNIMFYDMHQEWQYIEANKSWSFGADWRQNMYITAPAMPRKPLLRTSECLPELEGWKN